MKRRTVVIGVAGSFVAVAAGRTALVVLVVRTVDAGVPVVPSG